MFENIGGKIKILAQVIFWTSTVLCVICSIVVWFSSWEVVRDLLFVVLVYLALGIDSFMMYGFGQLVENTDIIVTLSKRAKAVSAKQANVKRAEVGENAALKSIVPTHQWRCPDCGKMISEEVCPYCK